MAQVARQLPMEEQRQRQHTEPQRQRRTNTTPAAQPKRRLFTKGEIVIFTAGVLMIMAMAAFVVAGQAKLFTASSSVSQLQNKIEATAKVNNQLQVQKTELSSPERIMKYAKEHLGLTLNADRVKVVQ